MEEDRDTEAASYLGLDFSTQQVGDGCIVSEMSLTPSSGPDQGCGDQRQSRGDGRDPRPLRLHAARVPHGEY